MFENYTDLFQNRADCFNQLFCTIDNSYEWVNGEIVVSKKEREEYYRNLLVNEKAFRHKVMEDFHRKLPHSFRLYFFLAGYCKMYAYLFNYPKEIKPDWKNAIDECKRLLKEDGYDLITEIDREKNWGIYIKEVRKARS